MHPSEIHHRLACKLAPYVPERTVPVLVNWLIEHNVVLTIKPHRNSKYGDYCHPSGKHGHRISINKNLNRYAFLITFIHEMAHLKCWEQHRNKVKAHGKEWKMIYTKLLLPFLSENIFPQDVHHALLKYALSPSASTCSDIRLMRALSNYDKVRLPRVEELQYEALFKTVNGRLFKKGNVIRKRILCIEVKTKRVYLFHPLAEVIPQDKFE